MFVAGLTGGIASGKSTVAAIMAQAGAHVVDADLLAREVVRPGYPAYEEIRDLFVQAHPEIGRHHRPTCSGRNGIWQ